MKIQFFLPSFLEPAWIAQNTEAIKNTKRIFMVAQWIAESTKDQIKTP